MNAPRSAIRRDVSVASVVFGADVVFAGLFVRLTPGLVAELNGLEPVVATHPDFFPPGFFPRGKRSAR